MKADYYLGQAVLATEIRGFVENLKYEVGLQDGSLIHVLDAFLENKERVTKEIYISVAPVSHKKKLIKL